MKRLTFLSLFSLMTAAALATGDFFEESIPALPTFLGYNRLPKKSLLDIAREGQPAPATTPDFRKGIAEIAAALKAGTAPKDLLGKAEALIAAERQRTKRIGPGLNALLHDVHDLCASGAEAAPASEYLAWRLAHAQLFGYSAEDGREWSLEFGGGDEEGTKKALEEAKKRAEAAPAAVKPNYLYAQGALLFQQRDDAASGDLFADLAEKFPAHPRAEAAAYMAARCLARQSRISDGDAFKNDDQKVAEARRAYEAYLKKYPNGRFAGDVLGFLGGLEMNAGRFAEALPYFVQQLDVPGHPELAVSAAKEIESCFRQLNEKPAVLAAALKDARVLEAAVYFAFNEIEPVDGNGTYETPEFVEGWRKKLVPALGQALAEHADLFKDPKWQPRYTALVALTSSASGQMEAALKLVTDSDAGASDDLAFARGVVFQRAKKYPEAITAFRFLAEKFPQSPLTPGGQVRAALALLDIHESGEAALLLMALDDQKKPAVKEAGARDLPQEVVEPPPDEDVYSGESRDFAGVEPADPGQIRQLLDTILNFGPLAELVAAAKNPQAPEVYRAKLSSVIAVRHLARERFAEAKPFMTEAEWKLMAGPLEELTSAAQTAKTPAEKAATAMKLAEAWAAARGKLLTVPLDTEEWRKRLYKDDHAAANFRRIENGKALGFSDVLPLDLESRDELRHAFNWWLVASDAQPRSPLAAAAIWRALRAMPDIALVSTFTLDRAAARKWGEVSKKLYDRLEKEHPEAPETKRLAVYWTFPPGKGEDGTPLMRGEEVKILEEVPAGDEETPEEVVKARVEKILPKGEVDLAAVKKQVAADRKWAKEHLKSLPAQCVVNFFEDLDLFLSSPDVTPEMAKRYLELRYDTLVTGAIGYSIFEVRAGTDKQGEPGTFRGDEALLADIRAMEADPKYAKVADFAGFLEMAVTANHWVAISLKDGSHRLDKNGDEPTYWGRDYAALEKMCRAWLEKFPGSKKREAALLLHCRALSHAMEPYVYYKRASWPVASCWEGAQLPVEVERLKFDAKVWKAALDQYDKEFPKGMYADDVLGYRADLAVRLKDWRRALGITLGQLDGKEHLHPGAQNRLRLIFSHLAKDDERADLLSAIRSIGGARGALLDELKEMENMPEHPLRMMGEWLEEQAQQ
jgi:TolA-binding protein